MKLLMILVICYFLGSIPFSYIVVKLVKGVDIRTVGSHNAGATNAGRVLGLWGFFVVFFLDMMKSFFPLFVLGKIYNYSLNYLLIFSVLLILGHTYTIFLKFKGGKGVATGVGIFLALSPISLAVALVVFLVVLKWSKMVSLSSISGAIAIAISVIWLETELLLKIFTVLVAVFVIFKHKENIKRIIKGTESKIGEKIDKSA